MDSLYDQISSLGVTPEGKTLAAITSAQQTLYNTAYNKGYAAKTSVIAGSVLIWKGAKTYVYFDNLPTGTVINMSRPYGVNCYYSLTVNGTRVASIYPSGSTSYTLTANATVYLWAEIATDGSLDTMTCSYQITLP